MAVPKGFSNIACLWLGWLLQIHVLGSPTLRYVIQGRPSYTHEQRHFYANKAKTEMRHFWLKHLQNEVPCATKTYTQKIHPKLPLPGLSFSELISNSYPIPSVFVWVAWHYPPKTPVLVDIFFIPITRFETFRINWVMFLWLIVHACKTQERKGHVNLRKSPGHQPGVPRTPGGTNRVYRPVSQ